MEGPRRHCTIVGVVLAAILMVGSDAESSAPSHIEQSPHDHPPNFVIIFGDDWGWGDLGANSDVSLGLTPNLDKLAEGGLRFTDFHVGASVCTPSRAALLTGRLGIRTGVTHNFSPESMGGLPLQEKTIAEVLKEAPIPYRTGMVGKWHLGTYQNYFPTKRGFDSYVGVPYSIDLGCAAQPAITAWNCSSNQAILCAACPIDPHRVINSGPDPSCGRSHACISDIGIPLFNNNTIVSQPANLETLSENYENEIKRFISTSATSGEPFFLYFAASHVHVPLNTAPEFVNKSGRSSPFADALMEFDNTVGILTDALETAGVVSNTLILVTGDNGPWGCKCPGKAGGTAGPYQGLWMRQDGRQGSSFKTTVWEGGHRVVGLASWPGTVTSGVTHALASSLDYMPTLAQLAGAELPGDRQFDGISMANFLRTASLHGNNDSLHTLLFHPLSGAGGSGPLDAVRWHNYKAHFTTGGAAMCGGLNSKSQHHYPPLVFDLRVDPGESTPLNADDPAVIAVIQTINNLRAAKLANVSSTMHSSANYSSGPAGRAANCCNANHVTCRCDNDIWYSTHL